MTIFVKYVYIADVCMISCGMIKVFKRYLTGDFKKDMGPCPCPSLFYRYLKSY